jgi:hypothetical protein
LVSIRIKEEITVFLLGITVFSYNKHHQFWAIKKSSRI